MSAFETGAGVLPGHVSLLLRSMLCGVFFLWAAWNVYGQYQMVVNERIDIHHLPMSLLRLLFLCSLIIVVVYVA